jgi:uncharacterized protein YjbI with pentapeptide repeats
MINYDSRIFKQIEYKEEILDTNFTDCEFYQCMLIGINWSDVAKKNSVTMPFSKVEACELRYNIFMNLKLKTYNFCDCNLEGSYFGDCNLEVANFNGCNLQDVQFIKNNLTKADFRNAKNYTINIYENNLKKAKFSFPEAVNLLIEAGIILE